MKNKVLIIAEAGVNHDGDFQKAIKLIDMAAESRADIVKFQTFNTESLVSLKAKKAEYQLNNLKNQDQLQFEMLKNLEIPKKWYCKLIDHCIKRKIKFLSTGFDEKSIDFLDNLDLPFFKIPSGEISNKPYLEHIAKKQKKVILSTGMSSLLEVKKAIDILTLNGLSKADISVLHCNTEYPTPINDVNLNAMLTIGKKLDVKIGYSDHTLGLEVPIAAVAMGAKIIEKHFTLDKNSNGPDHRASLEPKEFRLMVDGIRNIEKALGSFEKKPSLSEKKNIPIVRKSIHLNKKIEKGSKIKKNDLIMLRPGDGISPMDIEYLIGKKVMKTLPSGHKIKMKDIS
jgi:N-acetylneuraminate synthase/N,N'-diacetyllegionaminate synthase